MSALKLLINKIIGDKEKMETERYFIMITLFSGSIFLLVACIVHLLIGLSLSPVYIAGVSSIGLMVLYYFVRFKSCLFYPKLILTVWGLVMLDLSWYSKYLSNGPILYYILIFAALVIWVWEGRSLVIMLSLYFLNLAFLFFIDYNAPEELLLYPDPKTRSIDVFVSFGLYSCLMIFLLYIVKKEFIRQKENAIKSDKLKSSFLANMSHEIRTPMNAIVGFSQLLSEGGNPKDKDKYINFIQDSSQSLLRLINDVIDLSKIEAGDMEIKRSDFSIRKIFTELKEISAVELQKAGKSDIYLDFKLSDGDITIRSDSLRLKQVLSNLLSNAIKFTQHGKIIFGCRKKKNELLFSVTDTGIGIPEKDQETIFEQFNNYNYQNLNVDGSGIGLAIVDRILGLLNGKIWINSIPGLGSTFYFTLPFDPGEIQTDSSDESSTGTPLIINESGKLILVVEDNELSSMLITSVLSSMKCDYHHVTNGVEAIKFVEANPNIRLILMDMKLPIMDGYEATRKIKEINPFIPVIAQSAFAMSGDKQKAIDAGCDDYLPKPIDLKKLKEFLQIYI
ncbi:ATP-binding protein [Bacteroidota bacterium]